MYSKAQLRLGLFASTYVALSSLILLRHRKCSPQKKVVVRKKKEKSKPPIAEELTAVSKETVKQIRSAKHVHVSRRGSVDFEDNKTGVRSHISHKKISRVHISSGGEVSITPRRKKKSASKEEEEDPEGL